MIVKLLKTNNLSPYKFIAQLEDGKRIGFGRKGYRDFLLTNDEKLKRNYIARHKVREDWGDKRTAGFWARWILWNKPTIEESIKDVENRFNLKIII